MNVNNNMGVNRAMQRYFTMNNETNAKNIRSIASGYKINSAADDAAGLAIWQKMNAQSVGISAASQNAQDGISMLQTAEGALDSVHSITNRMTELASRAGNGIYSTEDRQMMQAEYDQLSEEVTRIGESTTFNGNKLFDGSSYSLQVGESGKNKMDVTMGEISSNKLGLSGLDLTTQTGANDALKAIKDAVNSVSSTRGEIGAAQNGLQSNINNLGVSQENTLAGMSRIRDTNMGLASMNKSVSNVLNETSISMMKNAQNLMSYRAMSLMLG